MKGLTASLVAVALLGAALALPAVAQADDSDVLAAYISKTSTLTAQNKALRRDIKRSRHHRHAFLAARAVLRRQMNTLMELALAVKGQQPSSADGATAKQQALAAITDNARGDKYMAQSFGNAFHGHFRKALRQLRTAKHVLAKARRADKRAAAAFRAAGVL